MALEENNKKWDEYWAKIMDMNMDIKYILLCVIFGSAMTNKVQLEKLDKEEYISKWKTMFGKNPEDDGGGEQK